MKDGALTQCFGYLCGTVIIIALLIKDGEVALATAAMAATAMFGAQAVMNARKKAP